MEANNSEVEKYKIAEKKVKKVKNFYRHLLVYFIVNIFLVGVYVSLYIYFNWGENTDPGFFKWYVINIISTPVLWGLGVLVHGLVVFNTLKIGKGSFKPGFVKRWEEKQIQKYLND